uniref:Ribosomal protein S2 n=1 Tax=Thraustotheca clavata TaxID=74557 RepID=S5TZ30_9STRA|nr:ribosomal protein S2 [Thraustotheca clavata]AGS55520.1 ribosomal protein S2 [Thraustotheca clavata]
MINKKIKIKKIQKEYLLNSLFKSKNFYGESLKKTKKKNLPFIYGFRHNYSIINLKSTIFVLQKSILLIKNCLKKKKNILIIGDSFDIKFLLSESKKINFLNNNKNIFLKNDTWVNGLITNENVSNFLKFNKINLVILLKSKTKENYLLKELNYKNIPVITLNNTNSNIDYINYPIFSNTKNLKSLFFLIYIIRKTFSQ